MREKKSFLLLIPRVCFIFLTDLSRQLITMIPSLTLRLYKKSYSKMIKKHNCKGNLLDVEIITMFITVIIVCVNFIVNHLGPCAGENESCVHFKVNSLIMAIFNFLPFHLLLLGINFSFAFPSDFHMRNIEPCNDIGSFTQTIQFTVNYY